MQDNGKLNDLAAAEIDALERDGIKLTPADIVQLNALGWAVETPEARRHLARGVPVPVGGIWLWPMTLYAADWLDRIDIPKGTQDEPLFVAYAMANAYSLGDEFNNTGTDALPIVRRWAKKIKATMGEITAAVEQVLDQDAAPELPSWPADDKPMSTGDFSAFLAATNGGDPEFWERRCCIGYAVAVLSLVVKQNMADGNPTANDPKIVAERALGWAAEQIRARETAASDG